MPRPAPRSWPLRMRGDHTGRLITLTHARRIISRWRKEHALEAWVACCHRASTRAHATATGDRLLTLHARRGAAYQLVCCFVLRAWWFRSRLGRGTPAELARLRAANEQLNAGPSF
jgi:hypothetical protein